MEPPVSTTTVTLADRKARETLRRRHAAEAISVELTRFARERGGRLFLFGSCALGTITDRSDIDVLIDVDESHEAEAWSVVEELSRTFAIPADIHSRSSSQPAFVARVVRTAKVLG